MLPVPTTPPGPVRHEAALRILHVVPSYYPAVRYGGPIRAVHGLAAASAARGHDVRVYTTSVDGAANLPLRDGPVVDLDGVSVHYFDVPRLRRLYWSPALAAELRKTMRRFDVVHLHSIYLWPTWAAARCAREAGVPYVVSPHGMLIRELIKRKSRWVKTAWIQMIERRTLAQAAAVLVTADLEASEARYFGVKAGQLHKIRLGVDWPATHLPLSQGPFAEIPRPYALFLSRINWKKGLDRLINAWKHVPELALVIAGNDDEGYTESLLALARAEGIRERVHFVGPAGDEHKWALYANAELFVLPSYNENFGIVVAEAMAMACPVVVTPEVGASELVRLANAGIVVSGEPESFARAVRELRANPAAQCAMGLRGQKLVRDSLSWNEASAQMESVYRGVIGGTDQ